MHYLNKDLTKTLKESEINYLVWLRIKEASLHGNQRLFYPF